MSFQCEICFKTYGRKDHLKRHLLYHMEKQYGCDECGKRFTTSDHLKRHKATHDDGKLYQCAKCGVAFSKFESLKKHVIVHTEFAPFRCKVCNEGFLRSGDLKRHMLTHDNNAKHYKCALCDKIYFRPEHLGRHMVTHTDQRPYECQFCNKSFARKDYLSRHEKQHHSSNDFAYMFGGDPVVSGAGAFSYGEFVDSGSENSYKHLFTPEVKLEVVDDLLHDEEPCSPQPLSVGSLTITPITSTVKNEPSDDEPFAVSSSSSSAAISIKQEMTNNSSLLAAHPALTIEHDHLPPGHDDFDGYDDMSTDINIKMEEMEEPTDLVGTEYVCHLCNSFFLSDQFLQNHIRDKHKYELDSINRSLTIFPLNQTKSKLKVRKEKQQQQPMMSVDIKDAGTVDVLDSGIQYPCEKCNLYFVNEQFLKLHKDIKHKPKAASSSSSTTYLCSRCDILFDDKIAYKAHMKCHLNGLQIIKL